MSDRLYRIGYPEMRAAPAQIVIHMADNRFSRRFRVFAKKDNRIEQHSGCAIPALEGPLVEEGLLDGMEGVRPGKALDREDGFAFGS